MSTIKTTRPSFACERIGAKRQCDTADSVEHHIHAVAAGFRSAGVEKGEPYLPSAKIFARHSIAISVE